MSSKKHENQKSWWLNTVPGTLILGIFGSALWERIISPLLDFLYNKFSLFLTKKTSAPTSNVDFEIFNHLPSKNVFMIGAFSVYIVVFIMFLFRLLSRALTLKLLYSEDFFLDGKSRNFFTPKLLRSFVLSFFYALILVFAFILVLNGKFY